MNVQTGTPSNPSETLENVDDAVKEEVVVGGPILADTDNAVEEEVLVVVGGWR